MPLVDSMVLLLPALQLLELYMVSLLCKVVVMFHLVVGVLVVVLVLVLVLILLPSNLTMIQMSEIPFLPLPLHGQLEFTTDNVYSGAP